MKNIILTFILLTSSYVISQNTNSLKENDSLEINQIYQKMDSIQYSESDYLKMQNYFIENSELNKMISEMATEGDKNANDFREILTLSYKQATNKYGEKEIKALIYSYYSTVEIQEKFQKINLNLNSQITSLEQEREYLLKNIDEYTEETDNLIKVKQIIKITETFNIQIQNLKSEMKSSINDPTDYESMDKSYFLDEAFFSGNTITPKGQGFLNTINTYRDSITQSLKDIKSMENIVQDICKKFSTKDVVNRYGDTYTWLEYNYKGFPLVAALTKLTQMQSDARNTETKILSKLLN